MNVISFVIPGDPIPQARPRFTTVNGIPMAYDPPKCKAFKEYVRKVAGQEKIKQAWRTSETALRAKIVFRMSIPISWSKKKAQRALDGELRPTSKNDLDNLLKSLLDGLTGIIYVDDGQIVSLAAEKYYGDPMILVKFEELNNVDGEKKRVPAADKSTGKTDPSSNKFRTSIRNKTKKTAQ